MNHSRLALALAALCSTSAFASHPVDPVALTQQSPLGTSLAAGGSASGSTVYLTASSDAQTCTGTYSLDIEVRAVGTAFSNSATHTSSSMSKPNCVQQQYAFTTISNLAVGSYKWQVRERISGTTSAWVQFNAGLTAFTVPGFQILPQSVAFGNVRVGTTSSAATVEVKNGTTSSVTLNTASVSSPFTIATSPTLPLTMAAGDTATFTLTASPTTTGAQTGTFTVTSSHAQSPHTASVSVTGTQPALTLGATSVAFGDAVVNGAAVTQNVSVTNSGTATLTLTGATVGAPFSVSSVAGVTVAPGASHALPISFAPTSQGAHASTVSISSDAPGSPHQISVSGTGIAPQLSLGAPSISFPDVVVGQSSSPVSVSIANSGTGTLTVGTPTVSGPFTTTLAAGSLAAGASSSFSTTFSPTAPGPMTGAITIPSNSVGGTATLSLSGTARAPVLQVAPASHNFGTVNFGVSQTTVLTLSNTGDATLQVTGLSLSGAHASEYALQNPPATPFNVAPGGSTQLTVQFAPTGLGVRSASVQIQSNRYPAGAFSVPLSGTGSGPKVSVSPTALNFGSTNVNATVVRTFDVTNSGSTAATISGLSFNSGNAADFTTAQTVPFTVAPGSAQMVSVTFKPTAVGTRTSKVTVASNDAFNPALDVTLTGIALSPRVVVTPLTVDLQKVRVGQTATAQVSIQNGGNGPLTLAGTMVTGGDAARFTLSGIATPLTLQPGAPAAYGQITFAPTAVGAAASTLAITSNDPDAPNVAIPLLGEGVAPGITLSTTALNFGGQVVNRRSVPRAVTITNTGSAPLFVSGWSISGSGSAAFSVVSPTAPFSVAVGQSREFQLSASPTLIGEQVARLTLTTDVPGASSVHVDLLALGISSALSLSPTSIDFGTIKSGTISETFTVTLQSALSDPIPLSGFELAGDNPDQFDVSFSATSIPPLGAVIAELNYRPASAGSHKADLLFTSSDTLIPPALALLAGSAVSRVLDVAPVTFDFGQVILGEISEQTFTFTNKTSRTVTIVGLTTNNPVFAARTPVPLTVGPGASTAVKIGFSPREDLVTIGTVSAVLDGQDASTPEITISLTGKGAPPPETKSAGCASAAVALTPWVLAALALPALRRKRRR